MLSSLNSIQETCSYRTVRENLIFSAMLTIKIQTYTKYHKKNKKTCTVSKWSTYWKAFRQKSSKNAEKSSSSECKAK